MKALIACLVAVVPVVCLAQPTKRPASLPRTPEEMSALLEKRWPLDAIIDYCTPERCWDPRDQNLLPDGDGIWHGTLYETQIKPFDNISWYASVGNNEITYFLNAKRDKDSWWLEIGDQDDVHHPLSNIREIIDAEFLKTRGFVEGNPSFWRLPPMPFEKAAKLVGFRLDEMRPQSPGSSFNLRYVRTIYHQEFRVYVSTAKGAKGRGRAVVGSLDNPKTEVTVAFHLDGATTSDLIIRSLNRRNQITARRTREGKPNRR